MNFYTIFLKLIRFHFFKKFLDPNGVPSHEDVALPSSNQITAVPDVLQSPLSHHRRGFIVNCKFIALNYLIGEFVKQCLEELTDHTAVPDC